jgi:hypothetical protein
MRVRWKELSKEEQNKFTMENSIEKIDMFRDEDVNSDLSFNKSGIDELIEKALKKEENYYKETDTFLYDCLSKYSIENKSVAVIGSIEPWYESICLAYGGIPTTVEYNKLISYDRRIKTMTVDEYNKNPIKFDMVFSISTFEHDGLNRYGDPINPNGDLEAMSNVRDNMLKKDGLLFLAVPMGVDKICWNDKRIYGEKRWPKLIDGFEVIYSAGASYWEMENFEDIFKKNNEGGYQPVIVLKNIKN